MKIYSLFMSFLISCLSLNAQNAELDSLLSVLTKTKIDTIRLKVLSDIADIAPDGEWQKYNEQMGSLAQKLMISSNANLKNSGEKYHAVYLNNMGFAYTEKADFKTALDYYSRALKASEKVGDINNVALVLGSIGAIYSRQDEDEKALEVYLRVLRIHTEQEEEKVKEQLVSNYNNIGSLYLKLNLPDSSLYYFKNALTLVERYKIQNQISTMLYANLSSAMSKRHDFSQAILYSQEGLRIAEIIGDKIGKSSNLRYLAHAYFEKGDMAKSLTFAKQSLSSAMESKSPIAIRKTAVLLKNIYKKLGNYKDAFEMYSLEIAMRDSISRSENLKSVIQHQYKYEYELKEAIAKSEQEKKDAIAQKELQKQKFVRNGFMTGFVVVITFAGVFFAQRNKIKASKKRSDELLLNILPEEVAEELKQKGSTQARYFAEASVMFTDFKGFTQISEKLTPAELVSEIDTCFKAFDYIIEKHNIEKIKTIGDAYMCAGGLPVANTTHAKDVINAALEIQQFMQEHLKKRRSEGKEIFEIRIGIHTGPVVAGIVGVKKFAYDIWGDTVNIAARMESSGEAGKINISGNTYELIKDQFQCTYRGKIQAKNKGEIDMYFVEAVCSS